LNFTPPQLEARQAKKILLAGLAVMAGAVLIARLALAVCEKVTDPFVWENETAFQRRWEEILKISPQVAAEDGNLALIFGSSLANYGISPQLLDANFSAINLKTYNLGIGATNPYLLKILSRQLRADFLRTGHKIKLSLIEFTPFQATRRFTRGRKVSRSGALKKSLAINWKILKDSDAEEAVAIFAYKILGGFAPDVFVNVMSQIIYRPSRSLTALTGNTVFTAWNHELRGGVAPTHEAVGPAYTEMSVNPERLKENIDFRIHTGDLLELHFDPKLIGAYISIVNDFKEISEQTYIVFMPRNTTWVMPTADAQTRLARVKKSGMGKFTPILADLIQARHPLSR
jgi:hypothetical protein